MSRVAVAAAAVAAVLLGATAVGGDPDRGPVLGPGLVTVELGVEHSRFSAERLDVRRGTTVRFVVTNTDPIAHELVVGPPAVHARHAAGTEADHPPVPGEVSVGPNESASTVYTFDAPGTVRFACHLPGHVAYGMEGTVVVHD